MPHGSANTYRTMRALRRMNECKSWSAMDDADLKLYAAKGVDWLSEYMMRRPDEVRERLRELGIADEQS